MTDAESMLSWIVSTSWQGSVLIGVVLVNAVALPETSERQAGAMRCGQSPSCVSSPRFARQAVRPIQSDRDVK